MNQPPKSLPRKLHDLLDTPIPPEQRRGYYASLMETQYWPSILVGVLVMAFEAGMMIVSLLGGPALDNDTRAVYLMLYAVLFLFTLLAVSAMLAFRSQMNKKPRLFSVFTNLYGLIVCLWGGYLSAFAHRRMADITVFIYVAMCVAILANYRFRQALLVFGLNLAFFYACMFYYISPTLGSFGSVINGLIVTLLCITVSALLHHSRVLNYLNRITIQQQNEQISSINAQLRSLLLTDNLTGAYNRRYLDEVLPGWLERLQRENRPATVMMIDIDHFKQYNDIYGHQDGDGCLQAITKAIMAFTANSHGAFLRYGGEEFVFFLPDSTARKALEMAESTRNTISELNIPHKGSQWKHMTISVGVFFCGPAQTIGIHQAVHFADQALYVAKNSGRNQVQVYGTSP